MLNIDFTQPNVSRFAGVDVIVDVPKGTTVREDKNYWKGFIATGGACVLGIRDKEEFWNLVKGDTDMDVSGVYPDAKVAIGLFAGLADVLSPLELEAVLWHEIGHIVYGHGMEYGPSTPVGSLQHELDADAYAASKVGARAMIDAIKKIRKAPGSFPVKKGAKRTVRRMHKRSPALNLRIKALEKLL